MCKGVFRRRQSFIKLIFITNDLYGLKNCASSASQVRRHVQLKIKMGGSCASVDSGCQAGGLYLGQPGVGA